MKIIYTEPDGMVIIIHPSPNKLKQLMETMSHMEAMDVVSSATVPLGAVDVKIVEDNTIPASRYFRNAWINTPLGVDVDLPKAREIKMVVVRNKRNALLSETDLEVSKLDGAAIPATLRNRRQALRDLPAALNLGNIHSPKELEEFEPEWP